MGAHFPRHSHHVDDIMSARGEIERSRNNKWCNGVFLWLIAVSDFLNFENFYKL